MVIKMILTLTRFAYCENHTAGRIYFDDFRLFTLERPWVGNKPFRSCIPPGCYRLTRRRSEKFGHHYLLEDVPGREWILVHPANYASELAGCIAPGLAYTHDCHRKTHMVTHSQDAMKLLHRELAGEDEIELNIVNFAPEYP